jgi:hypothetical protein
MSQPLSWNESLETLGLQKTRLLRSSEPFENELQFGQTQNLETGKDKRDRYLKLIKRLETDRSGNFQKKRRN